MSSNTFKKTIIKVIIYILRFYTQHSPIIRGKHRLTRYIRFLLNELSNPVITISKFGHKFLLKFPDDNNRVIIYTTGYFEKEHSKFIKEYLRNTDITFDVGANIGWFTVMMADYGKICHAFEPNEDVFNRLNENVSLNGLSSKTKLNTIALGKEKGTDKFYTFKFLHHGYSSLSKRGRNDYIEHNIKIDTLSNYLDKNNITKVDFIKVDIEGGEFDFLIGCGEYLAKFNDCLFMMELNESSLSQFNRKPDDVLELFRKNNFHPFYLDKKNKLKKLIAIEKNEIRENLFFATESLIKTRLNNFIE
ncbi:MAG: FkbM family methyltransferase [Ignavibacteriaceae bacterium]|nr:FkbM family methyltransferase [Ignavibacteriaceae bacterium]